MRNLFRGYYKPTTEELAEIWENCIFSFDANVLLHIYCYTPETRDRFFEILHHLKDRIWIPYQVAYEYQKNRIYVISKYIKAYEDIEKVLTKKLQEIKIDFSHDYQRHPFIKTHEILENLETVIDKALFQLNEAKSNHPNYIEHDELREVLSDLLEGKVGQPYSEEELEDFYQKAEKRFSYQIPPGYKDANKPIPRNYGDVIIWFQLIDYAKAQQKPLIFITDDNKEDWWLKVEGESLEPRPDLIQEIISEVAGNDFQFYMYHSDQFMDYAAKFLGLPTQPEVIQEVREIIFQSSVTKRITVESECMRSVGYDSTNQVLEIEFPRGEVYQYHGVPAIVYADLMNAPSHGKYFNANIKDIFPCYKVG
ncbi:MAG: PIN domain-containing protein [Scytonema sp. PMC 1069.18]|nr:PIN domain-containing protein [Scytonema sp. PMC 1069.18]MEC4882872.1 PIN domain-containing protein [Scytonema sp. PMC 1070.18]